MSNRGFARQPCCMAGTMKSFAYVPMGKRIYCSCHATLLPCKTLYIHKRIRFVRQTDGPLVPMAGLVPIENDVIPMALLVQNKFAFTPSRSELIIIMDIPRSISQPHKTRSLSPIEPLESPLTPMESICEYWTTFN